MVHAFTNEHRNDLEQRVRGIAPLLGDFAARTSSLSASPLRAGTRLTFTPTIPSIKTRPLSHDIVWDGRLTEVAFQVAYAGADRPPVECQGTVQVTVAGLTVAQIPISIRVLASPTLLPPAQSEARILTSIFASYSHQDWAVVERFATAYRALGIDLFVDRASLLSGQDWRATIRDSIIQRDLFQLFWSPSSASSAEVAAEWEFAIKQVAPMKPVGVNFVRPVFWTHPMPPAPPALGSLHFAFVEPQQLGM